MYSWGHGENGRLGNSLNTYEDCFTPMEIKSLKSINIRCIASGVAHSMVLSRKYIHFLDVTL